jgi:putative transcriptional regulator
MKAAAFRELTKSIKQAGRIRRGEARPTRTSTFRPADVAEIRARLGKSQTEFARMIGVSTATLQNWEQGRRVPHGPALALLRVTAVNPRLVARALAS